MDSLSDDDFLHSETLTDKAYRALEEDIVTLRIPPGTLVSEAILSRRLGVGRTPVREALQRLAREWLVVIMPRRGIVVSEIDPVRQLRLLEARREIERLLARSAAKRATSVQRVQFREIASGMDQAALLNDDIAFMRLDRAFNLLVLDASGNEFAASAMSQMNGLSRRFWYVHYKQAADLPLSARLHATIARAIADGEQDAAARGSDALVDYIQAFARATIG
ncbi:MAG TPA: GntR family transcriptional regulator [Rhodopila sp.]|jgi:DNA-binding GntR family transcriptional regulator